MLCIRLPPEKKETRSLVILAILLPVTQYQPRLRSALPAGVLYVNGITSTVHGAVLPFFPMVGHVSVASCLLPTDGRICILFISGLTRGANQFTVCHYAQPIVMCLAIRRPWRREGTTSGTSILIFSTRNSKLQALVV